MTGSNSDESKIYTSECFLCHNQFKDPRILECFHTFCCYCLSDYIRDGAFRNSMECPLCRFETEIPETGATGFERNFYIDIKLKSNPKCDVCGDKSSADTFCSECDQNYCQFCLKFHTKLQATQSHRVTSIDSNGLTKVTRKAMCPDHKKEEMKYFCTDCQELICSHCNMTSHKAHESQAVEEIADAFRSKLSSALNNDKYKDVMRTLDEQKSKIQREKNIQQDDNESVMSAIDERTRKLHKVVDDVKREIVSQLFQEDGGSKSLSNNVKTIDRKSVSFSALYYFSQLLLEHADDTEIISNATKLEKRLTELKMESEPQQVTIGTSSFEEGTINQDVLREMIGRIISTNHDDENTGVVASFPCRHNYVISGIAPVTNGMAWVSFGSECLLGLYDIKGNCRSSVSMDNQVDDITASSNGTVYASTNSDRKVIKVRNERTRTYFRSKLCTRGIHHDLKTNKLFLTRTAKDTFFNMKHGDKCDIITIVNEGDSYPETISNELSYPTRIAVLPDDRIVISDWIDCEIIFLNKNGKIISSYKGRDESEEDSFCPRGVCCDGNRYVYVVEQERDCIHQLDTEGRFKRVLQLDSRVTQVWSVACDPEDKLWIGTQNGRVHVVKP